MSDIHTYAANRDVELGLRKFVAPECVSGIGARHLAVNYALNLGARKVLIVTDAGVLAAGWTGQVIADLESAGLSCAVYDRVTSNPHADEVMAGAEFYLAEGCNCIVAVGGGSPIDCAKGIGIAATNRRSILEFEGVDEVPSPIPPLICVPTTGGSSADVSQFTIITDTVRRVKIAIISKAIVPDVSLMDPETLTTMPAVLTADTGFDTVTHAFESYASNAHSAITDLLALQAVRLMTTFLPASIADPSNLVLRSQVMTACLDVGLAFSNAGLGLVHAMSHSLGGLLGTGHGEVNSALLRHVIPFNFPVAAERYRDLGEAMGLDLSGKSSDAVLSGLLDRLTQFQHEIGLLPTLPEIGVTRDLIPELAKKAMGDPDIVTNPREPTERDIEEIYERAF